jgi:hypothetical protein
MLLQIPKAQENFACCFMWEHNVVSRNKLYEEYGLFRLEKIVYFLPNTSWVIKSSSIR